MPKEEKKSEELEKEFDAENLSREPSPVEEATPEVDAVVSEAEVGRLTKDEAEDAAAEMNDYYETEDLEEMVDDDEMTTFEAFHADGYLSGERTAACTYCQAILDEDPFEAVVEGRRYNFCSEDHMHHWLAEETDEGTDFPNIPGDEEAESEPRRDQP